MAEPLVGLTPYEFPAASEKTWRSVVYTLGINTIVCCVLFSIFSVLRTNKVTRKFFSPKRFFKVPDLKAPPKLPDSFLGWVLPIFRCSEERLLETVGMDGLLYLRYLKFGIEVVSVFTVVCCLAIIPTNVVRGENLVHEMKAVDHDVYAACKQENTYAFTDAGEISLFESGMGVGPNGDAREDKGYDCDTVQPYSDFDELSMANINPGDSVMWVHALVFWFVSLWFIKTLWRYNREAVELRLKYLANVKKGAQSHTTLVTDIPGIAFGTPAARAYDMSVGPFSFLIPKSKRDGLRAKVFAMGDAVANAPNAVSRMAQESDVAVPYYETEDDTWRLIQPSECTDTDPWAKMTGALREGEVNDVIEAEFDSTYPDLVAAVNTVYDETQLDPKVKKYDKLVMKIQDNIDRYGKILRERKFEGKAETKFTKAIDEPVKELTEVYEAIKTEQKRVKEEKLYVPSAFITFKKRRAQAVSSTGLHHHDTTCWNTHLAPEPRDMIWSNLKWRSWERSIRNGLVWAAFAALCLFYLIPVAAVQAILNILPETKYIEEIFKITFVGDIILGILPSLALLIFLAILPMIINFMNMKAGMYCKSDLQWGLASKFWIFQFIVIFLYAFVIGSLFSQLTTLAEDPGSLITILGNGVPQVAGFYINFIMLKGLVAAPLKSLRVVGIVLFLIKSKLVGSERAKARLWQNQPMPYGKSAPFHSIALLLVLTYSVIHPVLLPFALLYFATSMVIWRYHLMYIAVPQFQSGGRLWPILFRQAMFSLFIAQCVMLGYFGIKEFKETPILAPLPIITLLVWRSANSAFSRPLALCAIKAAADFDRVDAAAPGPDILQDKSKVADLYCSPALKVTQEAHDALLAEVQDLVDKVAAYKRGEFDAVDKEAGVSEVVVEIDDSADNNDVEKGDK